MDKAIEPLIKGEHHSDNVGVEAGLDRRDPNEKLSDQMVVPVFG